MKSFFFPFERILNSTNQPKLDLQWSMQFRDTQLNSGIHAILSFFLIILTFMQSWHFLKLDPEPEIYEILTFF